MVEAAAKVQMISRKGCKGFSRKLIANSNDPNNTKAKT
jgi:hypothetical protein